jgi:hypothetical protein
MTQRGAARRAAERALEVKMLRRDMFHLGYNCTPDGGLGYMPKQTAAALLDARDADPLYRFFIDEMLPAALGPAAAESPEAVFSYARTLREIYPDAPRTGGVDPSCAPRPAPRAPRPAPRAPRPAPRNRSAAASRGGCRADRTRARDAAFSTPVTLTLRARPSRRRRCLSRPARMRRGPPRQPAVGRPTARSRWRRRRRQTSGLSRSDRDPRKQFFPHGDWDTRIPGTNPLLPAVNSKVRALLSSQETTFP